MAHPDDTQEIDRMLDAFVPADLVNPELASIDGAVERLARRAPPVRGRAPVPLAAAAVGLFAGVAAAAALLALWPDATGGLEPVPPPIPPPSVAAPAPAPPARLPLLEPPPEAPEVAPARSVAAAGTPTLRTGLVPSEDAALTLAEGRAVLAGGLVTYLHDDTHEPGVRRVAFSEVPVELEPVGTAFVAGVRPYVGAVAVTDGAVRVLHDDGTLLAQLVPGDQAVAVPDREAPLGVRVVHTDGLPLDGLEARLPRDCPCKASDVVAVVAALRLAARLGPNPTPPEELPL
jgi:hypothetical protein